MSLNDNNISFIALFVIIILVILLIKKYRDCCKLDDMLFRLQKEHDYLLEEKHRLSRSVNEEKKEVIKPIVPESSESNKSKIKYRHDVVYNVENETEYKASKLLTYREYTFYKNLKELADRNNLQVLMKIRLADLINVKFPKNDKNYITYFNKIRSKHIDFALADEGYIIALIELDDSTHQKPEREERDNFINYVLPKCGYKIIRTYGELGETEKTIKNAQIK